MLQGDPSTFYNADLLCHILHKIPFLGLFRSTAYDQFPENRIFLFFRENISSIQTISLFQDSIKYSVKGSKSYTGSLNTGKFQKPFFHFYCCSSGKSHNKNRGSRYLPLLYHMCCSLYNDGGFPRTGACQNHHRP